LSLKIVFVRRLAPFTAISIVSVRTAGGRQPGSGAESVSERVFLSQEIDQRDGSEASTN
jgi:hypothetical protein